jgi:zinc/manganese transport system substrate-binding protein
VRHTGDNPHVWYDLNTMRAYATALSDVLAAEDPPHAAAYRARLGQFQASLQPLQQDISRLRARLTGVPVTATEPVFGYMFDALGLRIRNLPFQLAVMNDTEPSAAATAAFEKDLRMHVVRLLVYNSQASNQAATRMQAIAREAGVPVIAATETEPEGVSYQEWMAHAIEAVDKALPAATPPAIR